METTLKGRSNLRLSEKTKRIIVDVICYLFVALFIYTAASKLIAMDTFRVVLANYPLIGRYHSVVAYLVPLTEIGISTALILPISRKNGLIASMILMVLFLIYILYMFYIDSDLPCSCGGIIAKLSWKNHVWFNSGLILLAFIGLKIYKK
ncbi:hypothetical protein DBR11_22260 [Pedobacter sp. HMWF019]|uniref:MauE/DoxX family redox-associated membrane protein n=1 Tax=Pedobacter sp. HMWF019 TaxID=2056856 RepID=UPI000D3CAFB2|nr:MauE/DoxX family redox-associated membrane protein [Pedobacter sp. HMWF019]PTS94928.1 hypothetical protein DBR11_22260 [Pedobacter sp. HMWF019]